MQISSHDELRLTEKNGRILRVLTFWFHKLPSQVIEDLRARESLKLAVKTRGIAYDRLAVKMKLSASTTKRPPLLTFADIRKFVPIDD